MSNIKYYGHSQEIIESIINQFKNGNLPNALSNVFVNRVDNIPSSAWSYSNRLIMAIRGTNDARGFKQWREAGRKVKKGSKAIHILAPCIGKRKDTDPDTGKEIEISFIYGFKSIPVFAIESTKIINPELWEKHKGIDTEEEQRLRNLPFREVAEQWGLEVTSYNGKNHGALGYYKHGIAIALGTQNLSTWAHELTHAADDKAGNIVKAHGQVKSNEVVAELGGATLLKAIGDDINADLGGAWQYILGYSNNDENKAIRACMTLINRICAAVDLIINTAKEIEEEKEAELIAA